MINQIQNQAKQDDELVWSLNPQKSSNDLHISTNKERVKSRRVNTKILFKQTELEHWDST